MFHVSSLGGFAYSLKAFADADGYVPEAGDRPNNFRWEQTIKWNNKTWADFIERASKKTHEAREKQELWQEAS